MKFRLTILFSIIAITAGCHSNPAYQREIAILRGEIIDLENKYFSLKSDYEAATSELAACRGDTYYTPSNGKRTPVEELPKSPNPNSKPDDGSEPMIDDGNVQPKLKTPASGTGYHNNDYSNDEISISSNDRGRQNDLHRKTDPQTWVKKIRIEKQLTRAEDFDGQSGDDGLVLVVQPIDQNGDVVTVAADMTISVIDPKESGKRQRISLHRLKRSDVETMLETSETLGAGVHLRLPWNSHRPRNRQVRVFVRFQTDDGRKLETNFLLKIVPPSGDRWTHRQNQIRSTIPARPASSNKSNWRPRR